MVRVGVRVHSLVTGPALCFTVFLIESAKGAPRPLPASILRVYGVCMCVVCVYVRGGGWGVARVRRERRRESVRLSVRVCITGACAFVFVDTYM